MDKTTKDKTQIDFIPGMPPGQPIDDTIQGRTNTVMQNSMPIVRIYPGIPSFVKGASLFQRKPHFKGEEEKNYLSYMSLLTDHGFSLSEHLHKDHLTLAYQADSFPTDSFANDYGENFLQSLTDVASTGAQSLAQMFGVRTVGEAAGKIAAAGKEAGGIFETAGKYVQKASDMGTDLSKSLTGNGGEILSALAVGGRLDFPMVWKSSGYQPSYTMTIRLYNPNPGSQESTHKYIAAPIAAIMLLGLPISADASGYTYSWPFIHRIWSPGIYDLDPAYISNITVIKGGDQQQIGYTQRLGVVDVRIDFGSLFGSMLASKTNIQTRPTLKKYIKGISGDGSQKTANFFSTVGKTRQEILATQEKNNKKLDTNPAAKKQNKILNTTANMAKAAINTTISSLKNTQTLPSIEKVINASLTSASQAPTSVELTQAEVNNPPYRISSLVKEISDYLLSKSPMK